MKLSGEDRLLYAAPAQLLMELKAGGIFAGNDERRTAFGPSFFLPYQSS